MNHLTVLFAGVITLSGCATTYKNVDASKIISPLPTLHALSESAAITIKRDISVVGSGLDGRFIYDGVHVVTLSSGDVFSFKANPGAHILGVKSYQPIMFAPVAFEREIKVDFKAGGNYEYILKNVMSAGLEISEIAALPHQAEASGAPIEKEKVPSSSK
jgi:hypothetical protein